MTTTTFDRRFRDLYGASPDYKRLLLELCNRLGCTFPNQPDRQCVQRLTNHRHHCSHNYNSTLSIPVDAVDHPVWLRWPDGTWAILSQPYGGRTDELDDLARRHHLDVIDLGPAPYGYGTTALLIVGTDRPDSLGDPWTPTS